jgi:hypothetical protein
MCAGFRVFGLHHAPARPCRGVMLLVCHASSGVATIGEATMRGGYGRSGQGNLASRTGADRQPDPSSPARHCFVDGRPSLLVEWRRGATGWEGRVISVVWIDAAGWATVERWLPASSIRAS